MITLNLANPEKSDIGFKISQFPDGQQSITLESPNAFLNSKDIKIYSRMNSFRDIELIICANQALRENAPKSVSLYVPYFLGARSDRKFSEGTTNYLKNVICPIINSQNFNCVIVLDPHSDVLEACLNNYSKVNNFTLVKAALTAIDNTNEAREKLYLVSPDAGAMKKIYDVAEHFEITNIVTAVKHRDVKSGKIVSTEVPGLPKDSGTKNFVIVDDICDGGRTFTELAKAIREKRFGDKIYLVVTHGIFSAGFVELSKHFDGIFTTNSVKDIDLSQATLVNNYKTLLNQFDIF
jgi:ribose-phosphate pyrophosphokinase